MKRTREQIKAELMKKAEEEIDRLLSWEEKADKPTLTQFEDQVLATRRVLSEAMLEALMTGQETLPARRTSGVSQVWAAGGKQRGAHQTGGNPSGEPAAETPV